MSDEHEERGEGDPPPRTDDDPERGESLANDETPGAPAPAEPEDEPES